MPQRNKGCSSIIMTRIVSIQSSRSKAVQEREPAALLSKHSCSPQSRSILSLNAFQAPQSGVDAGTQAFDNALACDCNRLEARFAVGIKILLQHRYRQYILQIALIPLHDQGKFCNVLVHAA